MAGREDIRRDPAGHERWELEQAQGVGDLGTRAADAGGELLLGAPEVVEELLVGGGLSSRASRRRSSSSVALTIAGTVSLPAAREARHRRSPMMSS
jgi:hypothetical protein